MKKTSGELTLGRGETTLSWGETDLGGGGLERKERNSTIVATYTRGIQNTLTRPVRRWDWKKELDTGSI